jgi:hypothetical protein
MTADRGLPSVRPPGLPNASSGLAVFTPGSIRHRLPAPLRGSSDRPLATSGGRRAGGRCLGSPAFRVLSRAPRAAGPHPSRAGGPASADRQLGVDRAESPVVWGLHACGQVISGASGAGASPGDGVFVPVSPVCLLTRPNRMKVSLGTRAGTTTEPGFTHGLEGLPRRIRASQRVERCAGGGRLTEGASEG